jgi:geranylgeranyl pyrophosphate synthase
MKPNEGGDLNAFMSQCRSRVESSVDKLLEHYPSHNTQLIEAMRYAMLGGGKRVRPLLVYAAAQACGSKQNDTCDVLALAIECIHAYSLVHDDLPAMDDDDLRRGQATTHKRFDEATAILAGDALQCAAFELISQSQMSAQQRLESMTLLAQASGARGMVMGQAIDLASVDNTLNLETLERMHLLKTGKLIEAAVQLGAIASGASQAQAKSLSDYARAIGLAFQVQDDILDVTSSTETLGKTQGADAALNKPTYVSLLGLEGAKLKAEELIADARSSLRTLGDESHLLDALALFIIERNH